MARIRLSANQKWHAVLNSLDRSQVPLSMTQLGKRIGYADGKQIKDTICSLYEQRLIDFVEDIEFGDRVVWRFYLTSDGKMASRGKLFPKE